MNNLEAWSQSQRPAIRPIYYVSDRPEAYELWGEISHEQAEIIGRLIAERVGQQFRNIEFRVDGDWHVHPNGCADVAEFIEAHLQAWVAEVTGQ